MIKFTQSHEWIKIEQGNKGTVGITHHAQSELGDIVYVELPRVGKMVKAGEEVAVLESTKAAADVYSPVTGEITEVNTALQQSPEKVNHSPEEEGWLFKLKVTQLNEMDQLLDQKAYQEMV